MGVERRDGNAFRQLQDANWNKIGRRLMARVIQIAGTDTLPSGVTAKDIAQTVILKTLSGDRHWDPEKGKLESWLLDQVDSELSNLWHSSAAQNEALVGQATGDDEDTHEAQDRVDFRADDEGVFPGAKPQTPETIMIRNQIVEERFDIVLQAVDGIKELQELFDAISRLSSTKAEELAELMNVPVQDVYNRLKRLRNRMSRIRQNIEE